MREVLVVKNHRTTQATGLREHPSVVRNYRQIDKDGEDE